MKKFLAGAFAWTATLVICASPASAQTRVVTIGDSWAGYVANGAPGSIANSGTGNSVQLMLDIFHPGASAYNGSFYGGTAAQHAASLAQITANINAAGPDVDMVWLSSGGNDLLAGQLGGGYSRLNSPAQNAAVYAAMQSNVNTVVNHILSIRPDIQVVVAGYDYINVWDGSNQSALNNVRLNLGLIKSGNTAVDLVQNADLNQAFKDAGALTKSIADSSRRVHYVDSFGLNNTTAGYNGYFGSVPAGAYPPELYPAAPTPTSRLSSNDPIHLNTTGYNALALNMEANFFSTAFLPAQLALDKGALDFGAVRVGTSSSQSVTASNAGPNFTKVENLSFGAASGPFNGAAQNFNPLFQDPTLGSDTAVKSYGFSPTARGEVDQNVTLASDSGSPGLMLTGIGVGPEFAASLATVDFGTVTADSLTIDLSNESLDANGGNLSLTNLTLLSAAITGPDGALFTLSGFTPGTVLGQGDALTLTLDYLAAGPAGLKNAMLMLLTDQGAAEGAAGETFSIPLVAIVVPEPGTWAMFGAGLLTLPWLRKRATRRAMRMQGEVPRP